MSFIIGLIIVILALVAIWHRSQYSLHMIQLEEYNSENFSKWIRDNKDKIYTLKSPDHEVKKPLVFTQRAKRLFMANLLVSIILPLALAVGYMLSGKILYLIVSIILAVTILFIQGNTMLIANAIMLPIENSINMGFYRQAQEKIKSRKDLRVIGITGSFGKTSTKFIVSKILEEKYKVLTSPDSYNTPMGLSKVINNELNEDHEIFVAEMGARKLGEIKEVAELCQPQIGILTSIGPVHMESFKNIDNIMKTKYELIEELPADGVAVFNYDNEYIAKLADKTFKEKFLYGLEDVEKLDLYADNIQVSELGSTFDLKDKEGNSVSCSTRLLGKHNIHNILAGASVAKIQGYSLEEICQGINKVEPIPHRLNIVDSPTGIIVIDDAFNSNPIGAKAALEVISQFKEGKKIIVTPGMVELGDMEEKANREFGNNIGKVCDYAILIGEKRTKPIYQGLMDTNYNPDNIFVVNTLDEATAIIGSLAKPKDVVLFENDLPDNYAE